VKEKLYFLNSLKFIAALCVILLHYNDHLLVYLGLNNPYSESSLIGSLTRNSYVFVEFFFIVSGLLFAVSSLDKIMNGEKFNHFFLKKLIRLFPVLIISTIIMYILTFIYYNMSHSYWRVGTLNLILLAQELTVGQIEFNNADVINGPAWYLFSLMFTYVVIYFTSLLYKKTKTRLCYLIPLFMGLGMWYSKQNYVFSGEGLARGLVSFTIGIYLGFLLKPYDVYLNKNKYKNRIIIKSIILVELVVAITLLCTKQKDIFIDNLKPYFLIYIFPSVILLLYDFKYINKFNEFKIVQFITNSSYLIYLFDFPILLLTHIIFYQNNPKIVLKWYSLLIIIIIHIIIGMISYILIEDKLGYILYNKFENYYHNKITNKIE